MRQKRGNTLPCTPLRRESALSLNIACEKVSNDSETPPATPHRRSITVGHSARHSPDFEAPYSISRSSSFDRAFHGDFLQPSVDCILKFPYCHGDYAINHIQPIGAGRFSEVYLAEASAKPVEVLTPPSTPVLRGFPRDSYSTSPVRGYAVKKPVDRSSISVLSTEAAILSYLDSRPQSETYMVPFYGNDPRNNALIFKAMPHDLDTYISTKLNTLEPDFRTKTLVDTLPAFLNHLAEAVTWLHGTGIIHADIKTSNILLDYDVNNCSPIPLLADFTSSFHTSALQIETNSKPPMPIGGGTYDYLAPELLKKPNASNPNAQTPTFASDIWATTMTILLLVTGKSIFTQARNTFMLIEWVKAGQPLDFIDIDPVSSQRFQNVTSDLLRLKDFDVLSFLRAGFARNPEKRLFQIGALP